MMTEKEKLALRMAVQIQAALEPLHAGMCPIIPTVPVVTVDPSWLLLPLLGRGRSSVLQLHHLVVRR